MSATKRHLIKKIVVFWGGWEHLIPRPCGLGTRLIQECNFTLYVKMSMLSFSLYATSFTVHNSEWCVLGHSLRHSPCFGSTERASGGFPEGQVLLHCGCQEAVQYNR